MKKRYKRILVPLDGSELAELALNDALVMAKLNQAEVTLLQVVSPVKETSGRGTDDYLFLSEDQKAAQKGATLLYLQSVCQRMSCESITVHAVVEMGRPAEAIIDYANRHAIDLIVMATHGRSGLSRWVYGSVADKVLRGATVPVLLVRSYSQQERMRATP